MNNAFNSATPGEILVQERSQWQELDSFLCFCWSGESVWPCPPKGLVVGYEKGGGQRVDSASSTSYVQQCMQPSKSWLWVQWGIWRWCWGLSTAALSRRLRLVTVCSKWLIVSATWVTCSVLVVAVWLLPLPDASVPGVSFEKTFLCSRPSLCLSTWGVICLALMYVVQCYMVRKLGP